MEVINAIGRRKAAVARVFVSEGSGKIVINKRDIENYFPSTILQYIVKQPLNKLNVAEKYDIKVNLQGGGYKGQAEAARLGIARALVERKKSGRPKARKRFQFSKR
jgi:small subunit ribosomal protein S9